jgi:hypothetical protein
MGGVLANGGGWNPTTQAYAGVGGSDMKAVSLAFANNVGGNLRIDAEPMFDAERTIQEWQSAFAGKVKAAIVAMGAFAVGGFSRFVPDDLKRLTAEVRFNLRKLRGFARDAEQGESTAGSEDQIRNRSGLYGARLNGLYEATRRESHARALDFNGVRLFTEERSVLGNADHCDENSPDAAGRDEPGCVQEAAKGWAKIGSLSPIGSRLCLMHCKCRMVYRRTPADEN